MAAKQSSKSKTRINPLLGQQGEFAAREARDIYNAMQGPNEFVYIGNLKDWNRVPDMHRIAQPAYIIVGEHDELTPACAMKMHHALPNSTLRVFKDASHSTCFETPEPYYRELLAFLESHRG